MERTGQLSVYQAGFTADKRIEDNFLLLNYCIDESRREREGRGRLTSESLRANLRIGALLSPPPRKKKTRKLQMGKMADYSRRPIQSDLLRSLVILTKNGLQLYIREPGKPMSENIPTITISRP